MESRLKLDALLHVKQLPNLKHLTLDGIDIPEGDVEKLRKELPNWRRSNLRLRARQT